MASRHCSATPENPARDACMSPFTQAARNASVPVRQGVNGRSHPLASLGGPAAFPPAIWAVFAKAGSEQRIGPAWWTTPNRPAAAHIPSLTASPWMRSPPGWRAAPAGQPPPRAATRRVQTPRETTEHRGRLRTPTAAVPARPSKACGAWPASETDRPNADRSVADSAPADPAASDDPLAPSTKATQERRPTASATRGNGSARSLEALSRQPMGSRHGRTRPRHPRVPFLDVASAPGRPAGSEALRG
jgi:hypothetical protein